jgi:hypothetical protein
MPRARSRLLRSVARRHLMRPYSGESAPLGSTALLRDAVWLALGAASAGFWGRDAFSLG